MESLNSLNYKENGQQEEVKQPQKDDDDSGTVSEDEKGD
jgi:hypothetical protein